MIIIIILLPYILTVFIKGEGALLVQSPYVNNQVTVVYQGNEIEVTWDEFLIGVLAREIPEEYAYEAIKAQAIIIQTRLALEAGMVEDYIYEAEFYTTDEIQNKWENNSVEIYSQLVSAVEETRGMTLEYNGELASTPYHFLNTGMTRDGNEVLGSEEYDYLVSVSCPLDVEAETEIGILIIEYEEFQEILEGEMEGEWKEVLVFEDIQIISEDEAGYVLSVEVQGNTISGELFRTTLGLKSSAFFMQEYEGKLKITTKGSGHGLGLSQNTAHYMALEGKMYDEILSYFYSGTEIVVN